MRRRARPYWPSVDGDRGAQPAQPASSAKTALSPEESLRYLNGYPERIVAWARDLIERERLSEHLRERYPEPHEINSNKLLRRYTQEIKSEYLRSSPTLAKVCFDAQLHLVQHALGTHTLISRPHGGRLKAKRELRISSLFKRCPEPLLRMIVVHELAHLREREHNAAFYQLCVHMEPTYHQLELEARLYLIQRELYGPLYLPLDPTSHLQQIK